MDKILITGAAGFIGYHLSRNLCDSGYEVVGIDSINNYYDVGLKIDRLNQLKSCPNFTFYAISIMEKDSLDDLFREQKFDYVINLAAQAGVRFSIEKPYKYLDANLTGFLNVLEACRKFPVKHFIFASSSSVYGNSTDIPFRESQNTDHPVSLYAATKKSNEAMAHSYSALYKIPTTGLRFFTVYGPWGRPDMAYFKFTKAIYEGKTIKVYNHGKLKRDFTYIDDIVGGINHLIRHIPDNHDIQTGKTSKEAGVPYVIYNIGHNQPVELARFIQLLEKYIGKDAKKEMLPMQPGDVYQTYADISGLEEAVGYRTQTSIEEGLRKFVDWYRQYYKPE